MNSRIPAEVFSPGEYIRDLIESRGWTQADLAEILGRPIQAVNEIIVGKKSITPDTAQALGEAFDTGPEFWLNLESAYRLSLSRTTGGDVARRARLYSLAPIKEMVKRGWLEQSNNLDALEQQVLDFFEIKSFSDKPLCKFAARKSGTYSEITSAHIAWYFRARHLAEKIKSARFNDERFSSSLPDLRRLARNERDLRELPAFLSDLGIRFLVLEHFTSTRLDGAAFWLDEDSPVVVISLRYDRIDNFWFVLGHELAHVLNRDQGSLDSDLVGSSAPTEKPAMEERADRMASSLLIPKKLLDKFIVRHRPRFSKKAIVDFADAIGIHPGIVVGQLQHRREIKYSHSREMLVLVRDLVTTATPTDGWGHNPN